jgi:hypothetical protein
VIVSISTTSNTTAMINQISHASMRRPPRTVERMRGPDDCCFLHRVGAHLQG